MPRFRSVLAPLLVVGFAPFLFPVAARATCYEPLCCTYPPVTGTTHIESVSPQVALPGVTVVYIEGYCFGDTQGSGSITLNGEPMTDVSPTLRCRLKSRRQICSWALRPARASWLQHARFIPN
jgi:hypothetical protein